MSTITADSATGEAEQSGQDHGSASRLAIKVAVVIITAFALLSPIWVLTHGMGYLNQAPPPYWGMAATQAASGSSHGAPSGASGMGGC